MAMAEHVSMTHCKPGYCCLRVCPGLREYAQTRPRLLGPSNNSIYLPSMALMFVASCMMLSCHDQLFRRKSTFGKLFWRDS